MLVVERLEPGVANLAIGDAARMRHKVAYGHDLLRRNHRESGVRHQGIDDANALEFGEVLRHRCIQIEQTALPQYHGSR